MPNILESENQHIYITSDEEIKEGDYCLYNKNHNSKTPEWELAKCGLIESEEMHPISDGRLLLWMVKIILTTDQDLIKDGIQAIDDEFLEWFVKNPSCEEVKLEVDLSKHNGQFQTKYGYKIIIPKEEPKQETLEQAAERLNKDTYVKNNTLSLDEQIQKSGGLIDWFKEGFTLGAKWQAERSYSEEEVENIITKLFHDVHCGNITYDDSIIDFKISPRKWFNQFKKSKS